MDYWRLTSHNLEQRILRMSIAWADLLAAGSTSCPAFPPLSDRQKRHSSSGRDLVSLYGTREETGSH